MYKPVHISRSPIEIFLELYITGREGHISRIGEDTAHDKAVHFIFKITYSHRTLQPVDLSVVRSADKAVVIFVLLIKMMRGV